MTPSDAAVYSSIATVIIGAIIGGVIRLMNNNHNNEETTQKRTLDEAFRLIEVKSDEVIELRKTVQDMRGELQIVSSHKNSCEIRLARLEAIMQAKGLDDFLNPENGSATHAVLEQEAKKKES